MALVPAFCDTCGTIFASEHIFGGDVRGLTLENVSIGPCPVCGGTGKVPDGVYDFIGDMVRVLSAPESSREKLERLAGIIQSGRSREASPDEIASELEQAAPELAPVINVVVRQKSDPLRWIMLLLAIIGVLQAAHPRGVGPDDIERLTRRVVEEVHQHPATDATNQSRHIRRQSERPRTDSARRPASKRKRQAKTFGQKKKRRR